MTGTFDNSALALKGYPVQIFVIIIINYKYIPVKKIGVRNSTRFISIKTIRHFKF